MFQLTIKELAARKLRLLTTAFAVLLGVAFMAGTLVFTDTIGATFDSALAEANEGVDAYVRTPSAIDLGYGEPGPRLDASLADTVASVDGVDEVALRINGYAQLVGPDGEPVGDVSKSPAFGTNWVTVDDLNPYELASGHAPADDDEIVIDKASADKAGYQPGDVATVLTKGAAAAVHDRRHRHVRHRRLPCRGDGRAVHRRDGHRAAGDTRPGRRDRRHRRPRSSQADVAAAVQAAVGGDVEVITGATLIAEDQASLAELLAGMATISSSSPSSPCSSVRSSSTTRSRSPSPSAPGRWRCCGRSVPPAVRSSAPCSSRPSSSASLASGAGLVAGIGVAAGLRQLMSAFGFDMPDGPTVIAPNAMILSFAVGVIVTVLSAWLPARRAARIAPIAALREVSVDRSAGSARRAVAGSVITAAGVAALLAGLGGELALVGVGALTTFVGVSVLGPVLARPVATVFGLPLRMRGLSGELATRNAMRNPKRTARTASSLMIGVALVGFITVFAASAKTSMAGSLETEFTGTHIVEAGGSDNSSGSAPTWPTNCAPRRVSTSSPRLG